MNNDREVITAYAALIQGLMASCPRELVPLNTAEALHARIDNIEAQLELFRSYLAVVVGNTAWHTNCNSRESELLDHLIEQAWDDTRSALRIAAEGVQVRAA